MSLPAATTTAATATSMELANENHAPTGEEKGNEQYAHYLQAGNESS